MLNLCTTLYVLAAMAQGASSKATAIAATVISAMAEGFFCRMELKSFQRSPEWGRLNR